MFHLSVKPISRSDGRTATAAAAYRAGEQIADLRTGELHDYSRKRDVVHSEIVVPPGSPAWATDRSALWNAAEAAEKRKDARVARDYEVAIPKELTLAQGIELVRDFSQDLVDRHGVAVDFNVHRDDLRKWDGSEKGWQGYHAHILTTTRKLGRDGFGDKADPELSNAKRKSLGLCEGPAEIAEVRERWEMYANRHLERAGALQRIDRRSLKDQGVDRDPTVHLGPHVTGLERIGVPSRLGDINRKVEAEQQARIERQRVIDGLTDEILGIYVDIVERGGRDPRAQEREREEWWKDRPEHLAPHERAAVRAGMWALVRERDLRVQQVLLQAQERQERRDKAYQAIAKAEPVVSTGMLDVLQRKAHDQALAAWQVAKEAAAKLVEQAKRLATRLLELAQPQRLVAWSHDQLQRERPELLQGRVPASAVEAPRQIADLPHREAEPQRSVLRPRGLAPDFPPLAEKPAEQAESEQAKRKRAPLEAAVPSVPEVGVLPPVVPPVIPPKRDWNRYKALQQDLAKKGLESLRERGAVPKRDDPEIDPPERTRTRGPRR